jgi:hypothetical protein
VAKTGNDDDMTRRTGLSEMEVIVETQRMAKHAPSSGLQPHISTHSQIT